MKQSQYMISLRHSQILLINLAQPMQKESAEVSQSHKTPTPSPQQYQPLSHEFRQLNLLPAFCQPNFSTSAEDVISRNEWNKRRSWLGMESESKQQSELRDSQPDETCLLLQSRSFLPEGQDITIIGLELHVSSGDCEQENVYQAHAEALPLSSFYKPKLFETCKEFEESDFADVDSRRKPLIFPRSFLIPREESEQLSEEEDFPKKCRKCSQLTRKIGKLQIQRKQLQQEVSMLRYKTKPSPFRKESSLHNIAISTVAGASLPANQNAGIFKEKKSYCSSDRNVKDQAVDASVGQGENQSTDYIHQRYRSIIEKLKKYYGDKISKMESDFKNFMGEMSKRSIQAKIYQFEVNMNELKPQACHKKLKKARSQRQGFCEIQQSCELKNKIILLENSLQKQKNRFNAIQKWAKKIIQKSNTQNTKLIRQRNTYLQKLNQQRSQFSSFMSIIAHKQVDSQLYQSDFFNRVAQSVFQISNCIPFEDNDEQNLFIPENNQEVYDMIERIRRFYFRVEEYHLKLAEESLMYKRGLSTILKELADSEKASLRVMLELVKKHKDIDLQYIRNYIIRLKQNRSKVEDRKCSPKRRVGKASKEKHLHCDEADHQ